MISQGSCKVWTEFEALFPARAEELALDDDGQALNNANVFVQRWRKNIGESQTVLGVLLKFAFCTRLT